MHQGFGKGVAGAWVAETLQRWVGTINGPSPIRSPSEIVR